MQSPINKYGELEITGDKAEYRMHLSYLQVEALDDLELAYRQKGSELAFSSNYIFAKELKLMTNRVCFEYELPDVKSFYYLRQLYFEEQVQFFRSFIEMVRNDSVARVLWDKNNFFVDLTDYQIKALIFEFPCHPVHQKEDAFAGAKEMILLTLTTLPRVHGKPRLVDFIDQRESVIRFAEQLIRTRALDELEQLINQTIRLLEEEANIKKERQAELRKLGYFARRKELKQDRKERERLTAIAAASTKKQRYEVRTPRDLGTAKANKEEKESLWSKVYNSKITYVGAAALAVVILFGNLFGGSGSAAKGNPVDVVNGSEENEGRLGQLPAVEETVDVEPKEEAPVQKDEIAATFESAYQSKIWIEVITLSADMELTDRQKEQLLIAYLAVGYYPEADRLADNDPLLQQTIKDYKTLAAQLKAVEEKLTVAQNKGDQKNAAVFAKKIEKIKSDMSLFYE